MTPELEKLLSALRELHLQAGRPSTRSIAKSGTYSHTTIAAVLKTSRLPAWTVLADIVRCLSGDTEAFLELWVEAARAEEDPLRRVARSWLNDHTDVIIDAIVRTLREGEVEKTSRARPLD